MKIYAKNLTEFRRNLRARAGAIRSGSREAVLEIAAEALRRIVLRTPVLTGRARGNWNINFGVENTAYDENRFDKSGGATIARGIAELESRRAPANLIYISNGVSYVQYLERGTSRMAARAMVRLTMVELRPLAKKVLRAKITGIRTTNFGV